MKAVAEQSAKQFLCFFSAFVGKHDRFVLVLRVTNEPLFTEPVQRLPIMPLPRTRHGELAFAFGETGEMQESQHRIINLLEVGFHRGM
jgi:hypothetical protein